MIVLCSVVVIGFFFLLFFLHNLHLLRVAFLFAF